uniref:Uncharacterized protein n=1 Tax=Aureoumbra lagunensis TaxID=44058 RepID=A0A7S3JUD3_9STRA|mmetsp:Transcript_12944/g.19387  ORF Transcript_12944/g.19387 Transcript_12944/m.19387 type:complete len:154 (-) Transcript_12944:107-568(-)
MNLLPKRRIISRKPIPLKKSADDTAAENKAPSPLTLALRFAGFFAIIANGISSVIGPDLLVISKRVTSRLSDALLDPKKPRPTTLLDGLQLSEDAILKEIRLAPTKGVAGFLFSEGDPSSFEANIIDDASSSRLLLQGDDNDELRRRQEGEKK